MLYSIIASTLMECRITKQKLCRQPDCPEATAQVLFRAMTCCEDTGLVQRSFRSLATLCGFGDEAAMAGIRDVPPIGTPHHSA